MPDQLTDYMKRKIFDRSTHFIRPEFHWENVGGTHRLKIDNEGITNSDYKILSENAFFIHLDIAEAFNLVIPKKDGGGYQLTSLVSAEHFKDPLGHVAHVGGVQKLWSIVSGAEGSFKPEGTDTNSKFLKLDSSVNCYIYEIDNQIYKNSLKQSRALYVYTDLVQTQMVGKSETDLLRKVEYGGSSDKIVYEPQHLQFLPVRKNAFDTIEIGISVTDGTQTRFLGGNIESTVVTLCFKRAS